jgi:hypothetical protein
MQKKMDSRGCGNDRQRGVVRARTAEILRDAQIYGRRVRDVRRTNGFKLGIRVQAFTLRWWVLGMRMSSRYFATVRRVTQ